MDRLHDAALPTPNPHLESTSRGLTGLEHFAMPTRDIAGLERFVREILGGVPYYYAGYDEVDRRMGRKPHIFMRVGEVLFQCTEEGGPMHPSPADPSVSPHWAFGIEAGRLDGFTGLLRAQGIPYAGPYRQPQHGVTSIYFMSPEGHKLEICEAGAPRTAAAVAEADIDWGALANAWTSKAAVERIGNINAVIGARDTRTDNASSLTWMHHFTLPVKDVARMEAFMTDLLDATRTPGGPLLIGKTGFECTVEPGSPLYPVPGDDNISPHWSFGADAATLDHYKDRVERAGIFVAGPYRHRSVDLVSIYFKSPEGHKIEIGTWEPYPEEKAGIMGAPGVGFIPWPSMDHDWQPQR